MAKAIKFGRWKVQEYDMFLALKSVGRAPFRRFRCRTERERVTIRDAYSKNVSGGPSRIDMDRWVAEDVWEELGRPYYKVYPVVCEMCADVSLSFPGQLFNSPYTSFEVRIPENGFLDIGRGAMLVTADAGRAQRAFSILTENTVDQMMKDPDLILEMSHKADADRLMEDRARTRRDLKALRESACRRLEERGPQRAVLSISAMDPVDGGFIMNSLSVHGDESLEEAYRVTSEMPAEAGTRPLGKRETAMIRKAHKLALVVCCFGVGKHEWVLPDVPYDLITSRYKGKKREAMIEREESKSVGWTVGSETDLPRPIVERDGHPEDRGGELTHGHLRSSHFRMQACGPGLKDRKLIIVDQTVVRPDLPQRTRPGYRIGAKLERKHGGDSK